MDPERARQLDRRLVRAAAPVRVLSTLTWGEGTIETFLAGWRAGQPRLPEITYVAPELADARAELAAVVAAADLDDPLQAFVAATARSYETAAQMLEAIGTPRFTEHSRALYGSPTEHLPGGGRTHLELAESLLANTGDLAAAGMVDEEELCLSAEEVRSRLLSSFAAFFGERAPRVEIDPGLASKATAGSRRVRLRGRTCFSEIDVDQLREHEGFVHAATKLNGRAQPVLSCLGLSAPRTTLTQEGLATFAEVITRTLDIARLRRIALRIVAIQDALDGADFIELFRRFIEAGQSESESAHSAMRICRGGSTAGGIPFTKDVVYLCGLVAVHTYARKAIAAGRPELVRRLFAGRLSLSDVSRLGPAFDAGHLAEGDFVPPWASEFDRLGAYLAFGAAIDLVDLATFSLEALA